MLRRESRLAASQRTLSSTDREWVYQSRPDGDGNVEPSPSVSVSVPSTSVPASARPSDASVTDAADAAHDKMTASDSIDVFRMSSFPSDALPIPTGTSCMRGSVAANLLGRVPVRGWVPCSGGCRAWAGAVLGQVSCFGQRPAHWPA